MKPVDLNRVLRRPGRYWNIDGLPLLGMGTLWVLNGAVILVMESLQDYWKLVSLPLTVVFLVVAFSLNYLIRKMKQRITEPRTGAMRLREQARWPAAIAGFAAAFSLGVVAVVVKNGLRGDLERAIPCGLGLVIAASYFYASHRFQIPSYSAAGLCALVSGLTLTVLKVGFPASLGWFFVLIGTASIVCGTGDLRRFLRENPLPTGEETAR